MSVIDTRHGIKNDARHGAGLSYHLFIDVISGIVSFTQILTSKELAKFDAAINCTTSTTRLQQYEGSFVTVGYRIEFINTYNLFNARHGIKNDAKHGIGLSYHIFIDVTSGIVSFYAKYGVKILKTSSLQPSTQLRQTSFLIVAFP